MTPHRLLIGALDWARWLLRSCSVAGRRRPNRQLRSRISSSCSRTISATANWASTVAASSVARHPAHRQACQRRHAPAQLQRRSAMHALSVGAHDGPLRHPLRHLRGPDRRRPGWIDAVGSHHRRAAIGAGLCHRHMGQMASRQRRRAVSHQPGLRRVVRHPAHLRRGDVAVIERDEEHVAIGRQQAGLGREGRPP